VVEKIFFREALSFSRSNFILYLFICSRRGIEGDFDANPIFDGLICSLPCLEEQ
jgi:hypothetical protein